MFVLDVMKFPLGIPDILSSKQRKAMWPWPFDLWPKNVFSSLLSQGHVPWPDQHSDMTSGCELKIIDRLIDSRNRSWNPNSGTLILVPCHKLPWYHKQTGLVSKDTHEASSNFCNFYCEKSNRLLRSIYIDTMLMASSSVQLQLGFLNYGVGNLPFIQSMGQRQVTKPMTWKNCPLWSPSDQYLVVYTKKRLLFLKLK